ncbi:hypothetical protein [Roseimaritima sediminicola]|uniref:hypothetical protein n=1 Tax=Roseimaritima sediminicola TaxID=2662066 RepID=UPI00129838F2|nr:hypothetical protein [Roseimaritima sediminicola]
MTYSVRRNRSLGGFVASLLTGGCVWAGGCLWTAAAVAAPPLAGDPPSIEQAQPAGPTAPQDLETSQELETPQEPETSQVPADAPQPAAPPSGLRQPPPQSAPPSLERQRDEAVRRQIQRALEKGETAETGDPILDGAINAIRRQGSVLDKWPAEQALFHQSPEVHRDPPALAADPRADDAQMRDESYYLTAESLLRSARLLSRLPGRDARRDQLINQLRREAQRCLAGGDVPTH